MISDWTFMLRAGALHVAFWLLLIGGIVWVVLRITRRKEARPAGSAVWALPLGVALIVVGLVGGLISATMPVGSGTSDEMMGAHMAEMMSEGRMGDMMGGETERRAASPRAGAAVERVTAGDFFFRPSEIHAPSGKTVNIRFTNGGRMFHTFTIEELDFDLRARPGATISGALRDPEPGAYEAVCTVPGHAQAGMRATIRVL